MFAGVSRLINLMESNYLVMNKELKQSSKNTARMLTYLAIVIVIVGVLALLPKIFSAHDMLYQTVAVVLSVVFTAVVTNQLLTGQSSNEESRERNIKVYENKITVYAEFISKMWAIMNDNKVVPEEITSLRSEIFNKLIFYLDDSQIKAISAELGNLKSDSSDQEYVSAFENITKVLRASILGREQDDSKTEIKTLWNRFNTLLPEENTTEPEAQIEEPVVMEKFDKRIHKNCVHFNIFDNKWQKNIFANGINALGLCEYGEVWRTNLVKRCKNNEIVFLYKTGGQGYVGSFLAKGWVVFYADGNGNLEKEVKYEFDKNEKPVVIESEAERAKDIDLFCAQSLIDDGSTKVSYLLVEPLVYCENGVGRFGVYRRTISSYDNNYAWKTLGRFKAMLEGWPDEVNFYNLDGEKKTFATNAQALQQIFKDNNVLSAEWDDNAEDWKDK